MALKAYILSIKIHKYNFSLILANKKNRINQKQKKAPYPH